MNPHSLENTLIDSHSDNKALDSELKKQWVFILYVAEYLDEIIDVSCETSQ